MRKTIIAIAIAVLLAPATVRAQQIIVNEFFRDTNLGSGGTEWVEVLLTQTLTAAQLEGFYIGDSTSATTAKFSAYKFTGMSAIASTFPAGTIIVVTGDAATAPAQDLTYNPGGGDWNLVIPTTNATYITGNGSGGDLATTDVVWVDTVSTGSTISANGFAVNWDSTPGTLGLAANVLIGVPTNTTGVVLASDLTGATTAGNWTVSVASASLTAGQPNGGTNTTYISGLRAALPVELMRFGVE